MGGISYDTINNRIDTNRQKYWELGGKYKASDHIGRFGYHIISYRGVRPSGEGIGGYTNQITVIHVIPDDYDSSSFYRVIVTDRNGEIVDSQRGLDEDAYEIASCVRGFMGDYYDGTPP